MSSKRKWNDCEYHVQKNEDVNNEGVNISCDQTQFPALPSFVLHSKPHGVQDLRNYYHL